MESWNPRRFQCRAEASILRRVLRKDSAGKSYGQFGRTWFPKFILTLDSSITFCGKRRRSCVVSFLAGFRLRWETARIERKDESPRLRWMATVRTVVGMSDVVVKYSSAMS